MASRCCTLLVGGVVSGIYSTAAYLAAFCIEVGWIIEQKDSGDLPAPIFVLAAGYFFTLVISIILLVGLARRKARFLLSWLVFVGFFFLPECGLVLYMALRHWKLNSMKGNIELTFYIARAVINVLTFVCIQSVFRRMKQEKGSLRRLDFLYSGNSFRESNGAVHHGKAESELSNGHSHYSNQHQYQGHPVAYANPLPVETEVINGGKRVARTASTISNSYPTFNNHVEVIPLRHYWNGVKSEFDASTFNQLVNRRSASEIGVKPHFPTTVFSMENGWDMPGDSNNTSYATHSLERPRHKQNNFARRSKSLEDVNRASGIPEEVLLEKLEERPFQYLKRPGNIKSDDSDTSDSHSIRDIAL